MGDHDHFQPSDYIFDIWLNGLGGILAELAVGCSTISLVTRAGHGSCYCHKSAWFTVLCTDRHAGVFYVEKPVCQPFCWRSSFTVPNDRLCLYKQQHHQYGLQFFADTHDDGYENLAGIRSFLCRRIYIPLSVCRSRFCSHCLGRRLPAYETFLHKAPNW